MKVAYWSIDWTHETVDGTEQVLPGGGGYIRCRLPTLALNKFSDIECYHFPHFDAKVKTGELVFWDWDKEIQDGFDIVILRNLMHKDAAEAIKKARAYGQIVINDLDDWWAGSATSNTAFVLTHPKVNKTGNSNHYRSTLGAGDALWVSTPYLASRVERFDLPTYVIRNAMDLTGIDVVNWADHPVKDTTKPTIGWVGDIAYRSGDLQTLKGILGPAIEELDLHFMHSGFSKDDASFSELSGVPEERITTRGKECIDKYPLLFNDIDIGIVPLVDTPFNHAKSCLKGMEYAASGIPYIAPRFGEYKWFGEGVLVNKPVDWRKAIRRLCDPAERQAVRDSQMERLKKEDITLRWVDWYNALQDLA